MINMVKLPTNNKRMILRVARGHFATSHSHINYYIDVTMQKTRLSEAARRPKLLGLSLDEVCKMNLPALTEWVRRLPARLPGEMRPMAESICASFTDPARRLLDLGLGYLSLDRAAATLSTGERQRMQLARAVRNRTSCIRWRSPVDRVAAARSRVR